MAASAPSALWAAGGELLAHRLVHRGDRLQRSDHHLEAVDSIFGIPIDDVDAIDRQTSESGLELPYSRLLERFARADRAIASDVVFFISSQKGSTDA